MNKKILIFKNGLIGDMIVITGFIHELKQHYLNSTIDVYIPSGMQEILKCNANINNIYLYGNSYSFKTLLNMKNNNYDIFLDLTTNNLVRGLIHKIFIAPKLYIGFEKKKKYILPIKYVYDRIVKYDKSINFVDNIYSFFKYLNINNKKKSRYKIFHCNDTSSVNINQDKFTIVLNISASSDERKINKIFFRNIITQLENNFSNVQVLVTSSPDELLKAKEYVSIVNSNMLSVYRTQSIMDLCSLIEHADLIITPDTSVVHLASSYNKPIVAFYTKKDENYLKWKPISKEQKVLFSSSKLDVNDINFVLAINFIQRIITNVKND
jgi:ADP-heptose:LPS heptosyltransferase